MKDYAKRYIWETIQPQYENDIRPNIVKMLLNHNNKVYRISDIINEIDNNSTEDNAKLYF